MGNNKLTEPTNNSFQLKRFKYCYTSSHAGMVIDKSWWNEGNELLYTCQETPMMSSFNKFPRGLKTKDADLLLTRNATPYVFIPKVGSIFSNVVQKVSIDIKNYSIKFLQYALSCATESVKANGNTIPSWNMQIWNNLYLPLPSIQKQKQIASFLDDKINKIDKLVEQLLQSIEDLNNCIFDLIDNEIFYKNRFYNFNNVSNNSTIKPFKNVFSVRKGLDITKENLEDSGISVISYGQTHNEYYKYWFNPIEKPLPFVNESYLKNKSCILKKGDFVFADTSEDIKGSADFSMLNSDDICLGGYHSLICKPKSPINSVFFMYEFMSNIWKDQIKAHVDGVKVYSLTQTILKNVKVYAPDESIQEMVVNNLDSKIKNIQKLIQLKSLKIGELKRLKTSLIYEYVSGKKEVAL